MPWLGPCLVALLAVADAGRAVTLALPSVPAGRRVVSADPTFRQVQDILILGRQPILDASISAGETIPDPEPQPLLDTLGTDLPCGTPLARAAARALPSLEGARRDDVAHLLAPPHLAAEQRIVAGADGVTIHFDVTIDSRHAISRRDADRNQVPDGVDALLEDVRFTEARYDDVLGWSPRGDGLDVHLGATVFTEGETLGAGRIVIPHLANGEGRLRAVAHQLAHVALHDMAPDLPESFEEALATYLAEDVVQSAAGRAARASDYLPERAPARALLSPGVKAARGDAEMIRFVAETVGLPKTWLRDTLRSLEKRVDADRPVSASHARAALVDALDETLARSGSSLADAVAAYQLWALQQDLLQNGARAAVDGDLAAYPLEDSHDGRDLPPFGQLRYGLDVPAAGGLRVSLAGDERAEGVLVALVDDGTVLTWPLGAGSLGPREVILPGSRLRRVIALVQAPTIPSDWRPWDAPDDAVGAPGSFTLSGSVDASYPFVLNTLHAGTRPSQVMVEWATSSETDVTGWIVERAVRLSGPFVAVSAMPLPPVSPRGEPASYAFVDPTVHAATRYHYRVRALTGCRLAESTPVLSVMTLPDGPRPRADE